MPRISHEIAGSANKTEIGFNEAGAFCPGYRGLGNQRVFPRFRFNEAGAFCPGYGAAASFARPPAPLQ